GFGNELDRDHGHRVAGHQGGGLAFNTMMLRFPDDQITVIVLGNLTQAPSKPLARRIATVFLPDLSDENNHGVPDPDPSITARLKTVLLGAAQGKVDAAMFAPEVRDKMPPFLER